MAHKMSKNCKENVEKQLVACLAHLSIAHSSYTQNNNQDKLRQDLDNIKDGFFWETIAGHNVPYIIRSVNGTHLKFVATRMAEYQLLKKYLDAIGSQMLSLCAPVKGYLITDSEVKILNYINEKHYELGKDYQFFARIDYIVSLEDIHNFYLFIEFCYKKLRCNITPGQKDKCGFICINSDSSACVPYFTQGGQKYLPLFYFETETENLLQYAVKLENWDLAYLKFCCKIHGIFHEFFTLESWLVVSLDAIKTLFPPETDFMDFWPTEHKLDVLIKEKSLQTNTPGSWFRAAPEVVLDQSKIPHASTAPASMMTLMQQQRQIITTPQIQAHENSNNAAYKIQEATLDGKTIHCINSKPYIYSDLIVTIKDLVLVVLSPCTVVKCAHVLLKYLKTTLVFGKSEQLAVLKENGLIRSMTPADTPMAMLKDITQVLPQLKIFVLMQDKEIEQYQSASTGEAE